MAVYIILTVVTVGMAYFVRKPEEIYRGSKAVTRLKMRNGILMCGIFALLFLVSACRHYVGNDYTRYEEYFRLMMIEGSDGVPTEIGFNLLAKGVQSIFGVGEKTNLLIFALFAGATIFLFLKGMYDLSADFSFSFSSVYDFRILFQQYEYHTLLSGACISGRIYKICIAERICQISFASAFGGIFP